MMFQRSVDDGYVRKVYPDKLKAMSLVRASEEAIKTARKITKSEESYKSIVRELYEGLRQYCEAIGFLHGYKFMSHETITYFLDEILGEKIISAKFDRYRKIRNRINYYGDDVPLEIINGALKEIPEIIESLSKYTNL